MAAWVFSDILGWDRNIGLCAEQCLPPNRFWANKNMRPEGSGVSAVSAAGWWDAIVMRPHRLIAELVKRCVAQGVRVTNHARVKELLVDGNIVGGVRYACAEGSELRTLRSKLVIDAAGHGGRIFRNRCDALYPLCDWVGAANFLLDEQTSVAWASAYRARERLGFGGADSVGSLRDFFFVPTPDGMLAGTTYVAVDSVQDQLAAAQKAFDQLIDECNRARPEKFLRVDDVKHMFWGLLPADKGSSGVVSTRLLEHDLLVDGKTEFGLRGYHRVQAVKLTTATELARETMMMVQRQWRDLGAPKSPRALVSVDDSDELRSLFAENSSTRINALISQMEIGQLRDLIRHCVRKEFAVSLEDLLQRRIGLLAINYPDNPVRDRLATLMGEELAWTQDRVSKELDHATKAVEGALAVLIAN
jgi:glycerol-3-phosphate dehydrogenase